MSKTIKDNNKTNRKKETKSENKNSENIEYTENTINALIVQDTTKEDIILSDLRKMELSGLNISDLYFLEKACALVCKRYETLARIDVSNNKKFKEYNLYYEKIFSEIEQRVLNYCKN